MNEVTIYTTRFCPYCIQAKQLLDAKGVSYHEIAVDNDPQQRLQMMELSGRRTVPQIWIGDVHVGGCSELWKLERNNELEALLSKVTAARQ